MKFVLSLVIVYVAFKPNKLKQMVKEIVIFYLVSFVTYSDITTFFYKMQVLEFKI